MSRKTISVDKVKEIANSKLELDTLTNEERRGVALLLERILSETDNYRGFNFVDWLNGGFRQWTEDGRPRDNSKYIGNETKRFYY